MKVRWEDFGNQADFRLREDYLFNVQAKRVRVSINDYATADTFELEIDYKNFPFDPRCIRACGVVIGMQDAGGLVPDDGNPFKVTPDNTIFIGFADDESIKFDDSSRTVVLEGRDYTSLLIDQKFLRGTINLEQPVDVVIRGLLAESEQTSGIKIANRTGGALPVLSSFWGEKGELSGKKNTNKNDTYWEVIQDIVARAGLIAYIELDSLVITRPRKLYSAAQAKRFVYGKNLKSLEYKRKLGRMKSFNVAVRSMSLETKEVLMALIPAEATTEWSRETGIPNIEVKVPELDKDGKPVEAERLKAAPYMSFRLPDIANKDQLIRIGQEIYEEIGRQQIEGSFVTRDMATSWTNRNGREETFDILKLRNGTPILIEIDQGDLAGLNKQNNVQDRTRFLLSRGYSQKAATALAVTLSNPRLNGPLYTKAVTFSLDTSSGFDCSVEFINFIQTEKPL